MKPNCWLTLLALGLLACSRPPERPAPAIVETQALQLRTAVAVLTAAPDSSASGTVRFEELKDGIEVRVNLKGLEPGPHGFHIHEKGDCSTPDFTSAGDHFNPEFAAHGDRTDSARHVGDLGNLIADSQGNVELSFIDDRLALRGEHSIVGRAVIVHFQADDLLSQPSGNAGARVACGVIELQP
jgi:Cu-Zn family superoxide dismutase